MIESLRKSILELQVSCWRKFSFVESPILVSLQVVYGFWLAVDKHSGPSPWQKGHPKYSLVHYHFLPEMFVLTADKCFVSVHCDLSQGVSKMLSHKTVYTKTTQVLNNVISLYLGNRPRRINVDQKLKSHPSEEWLLKILTETLPNDNKRKRS